MALTRSHSGGPSELRPAKPPPAKTPPAKPPLATPLPDRRALRRNQTLEEALDHAVAIMGEVGVHGLTMSEMARRLGVKAPSMYKYFGSLDAVYEALLVRGHAAQEQSVARAVGNMPPGIERLRARAAATVRWGMRNPEIAQLIWRRPAPSSFDAETRRDLSAAAAEGQLSPEANSERAVRLFTLILAGVIHQQLANDPGASYGRGRFTSLTDEAVEMFVGRFAL